MLCRKTLTALAVLCSAGMTADERGRVMVGLSPGQRRIREVLALKSHSYCSANPIPYELADEIRTTFVADKTISNDPVTGRRMDVPRFAWSYLWFLADGAKVYETASNVVPLHELMLIRSEFREAFRLGPKFNSTARALFGLTEGKSLPGLGWSLSVYIGNDDQITAIRGGGCHRTLAHYLYGEHSVGAERIIVYENRRASDPILSEALLFLERTLDVQLFSEQRSERQLLKDIYVSAARRDLDTVGEYLATAGLWRWGDVRDIVSELALHLEKLTAYRGECRRRYMIPWMRNQRLYRLRKRDPFISWYLDRQMYLADRERFPTEELRYR